MLNTALYATTRDIMPKSYSLDFARLRSAYHARSLAPRDVLNDVLAEIEDTRSINPAWIHVFEKQALLLRADDLERRRSKGESLPLYGIPFGVKDNIDVAGQPTTAACPGYSYIARETASVVQRLEDAGAICIGKTNMDQFATGLVGTRSPYGACRNPFDLHYVSGGSSSGSAVAVALGQVSFALGTDTAGSGRVPAGFCNIVGLKPTRGLISTTGVVPACRSLDCVSIFALTSDDARQVLHAAASFDARDPYSRKGVLTGPSLFGEHPRIGIPRDDDLQFFGDVAARAAYDAGIDTFRSLGAHIERFDYSPFAEVARLLYEGPWLAERLAAIRPFFEAHVNALHPIVRDIIGGATRFNAVDAFEAQYRLESLKRRCAEVWERVDLLALPTAGTLPRIDDVLAEPVKRNADLGYYTNFVNLLDLAAVAVPTGFRGDGLPFGITLVAPAFCDSALLELAARIHAATSKKLGATSHGLPDPVPLSDWSIKDQVQIAVVGAHLTGMPLNHQLVCRGGRLLETCSTAALYRLYALPDTSPAKPGLVRVDADAGTAIEVELWSLSLAAFGSFVAEVPPPLAIGTLLLSDGQQVKGFVCEPLAIEGALDVSAFGGWRNYLAAQEPRTVEVL